MRSEYTDRCSHRQRGSRGWAAHGGAPRVSLGQGLKDGIHLLRHSCQGKFKLVLGKGRGRRVMGGPGLCSCPGGGGCLGEVTCRGEGALPGEGYGGRQERPAAATLAGEGWWLG